VLAGLDDAAWDSPTPSPGWRVRDQIGHLAHYDEQAARAVTDPDGFAAEVAGLFDDLAGFQERAEALGRTLTGAALLDRWRAARAAAGAALVAAPQGARLPWYGPPMSVRSFATARLMETWAHGTDVRDGLGVPVAASASDRLRHLCHLGFITRGWSYTVRGLAVPDGEVRVSLVLPSGAPWEAGPVGAADVVRGDAVDFCLVVTQRRNVADTGLSVEGPLAAEWLSIAQCFAGAPTDPPAAH
jgi:uncharacterized protein (TIGR03084 family)